MKLVIGRLVIRMQGSPAAARSFASELGGALRVALGRAPTVQPRESIRVEAKPGTSSTELARAAARQDRGGA